MLFILLGVEYRAIDKEHFETSKAQIGTLNAIGNGFNDAAAKSQKNFDDMLGEERSNFETLMSSNLSAQRQEREKLAILVRSQTDLLNRQQEMIDSANGHLLPASDEPVPALASLGCDVDILKRVPANADYYVLKLNELTFIVWKFPFSPATVELWPDRPYQPGDVGLDFDIIRLTKAPNGDVVFALDIRDRSGAILVQFDEDGFQVGPQLVKRHPNKSTLIATDSLGNEELKVVYESKHFMRVNAHILVDGNLLFNPSRFGHLCMPNMTILMDNRHIN